MLTDFNVMPVAAWVADRMPGIGRSSPVNLYPCGDSYWGNSGTI